MSGASRAATSPTRGATIATIGGTSHRTRPSTVCWPTWSQEVIDSRELSEVGQPGERWDGEPPATLERILFHLMQEYARHLGHLDVVCELAGTGTGE